MAWWHGNIFRIAAPLWGELEVTIVICDFPHKGPIIIDFDVSFVLTLTHCWTNSQIAIDNMRHHDAHMMSLIFQLLSQNLPTDFH